MNGLALAGGRLWPFGQKKGWGGGGARDQTNKAMMMQCFSRHHCPTCDAKVLESSQKNNFIYL